MAESPPGTPMSMGRQQVLSTPVKYVEIKEGNEENALNFANTPRSTRHSNKIEYHDSISYHGSSIVGDESIARTLSDDSDGASEVSVARLKGWLDDFGKQNRAHYEKTNPHDMLEKAPSIDSDSESDLSVTRLKGWLDDFGKQNRAHYDKVNHIGKAPTGVALKKHVVRPMTAITTASSQPIVTKPVIWRHADPAVANAETKKGPAKTPVRYKPRYKKDEVQATNDGYASVKKIAAWLADDPTADKKMTTLRKGINVINKSRMFEKDLENVIIEENRIVKGSVSNKKDFFQAATFTDDGHKLETASCVSVSDKKKWLEGAFGGGKKPAAEEPDDDDDSIISMSVLGKKQWLQNAFNKTAEARQDRHTMPSRFKEQARRAESAPGAPSMTPTRDEAAVSLAKERFQNRAASRRSLTGTSDSTEDVATKAVEEAAAAKHKWQERAAQRSSLPRRSIESGTDNASQGSPNSVVVKWRERKAAKEVRVSQETYIPSNETAPPTQKSALPELSALETNGKEERTHVDFRAAREKLLQRSAQNGNPLCVISKVQKRKQKFERLEQEMRQRANPNGLLKPTWEAASVNDGPSTAYTKTFVDNIAPKKSFEDLP